VPQNKMKRLGDFLGSAKRFRLYCNTLHQFSVFSFCSRRFPPIRSPFYVKLSWELDNPSPFWFEELHANSKAFALQWLAVSNTTRGAKLSSARGKHQGFAFFPTARTDDARATRTHILSKSRFRAWGLAMPVNQNGNFHRNAPFDSVKRESLRARHGFAHPHRHAAMRVRF
jgi:hypothetical protein